MLEAIRCAFSIALNRRKKGTVGFVAAALTPKRIQIQPNHVASVTMPIHRLIKVAFIVGQRYRIVRTSACPAMNIAYGAAETWMRQAIASIPADHARRALSRLRNAVR